jgi:deazaflavin-dependent oxidoreductase (nitroreductase family)
MQRVMRLANWAAVGLYRRTGGRIGGSAKGVDVLLLTVSGRRTGKPFTVPVAYLPHGVGYVVTGSADGMKDEPQWFRNLRVTDRAEVQIGRTRTPVVSRVAEGAERDELWQEVVLARAPFFAKYEEKSGRTIPVATLVARP